MYVSTIKKRKEKTVLSIEFKWKKKKSFFNDKFNGWCVLWGQVNLVLELSLVAYLLDWIIYFEFAKKAFISTTSFASVWLLLAASHEFVCF